MPSRKRHIHASNLYHCACTFNDQLADILPSAALAEHGIYSQYCDYLLTQFTCDCDHAGRAITTRVCSVCFHNIAVAGLRMLTDNATLCDQIADQSLQLAVEHGLIS